MADGDIFRFHKGAEDPWKKRAEEIWTKWLKGCWDMTASGGFNGCCMYVYVAWPAALSMPRPCSFAYSCIGVAVWFLRQYMNYLRAAGSAMQPQLGNDT